MSDVFSSPEFEAAYTYGGHDLGASWSPEKTAFRLWAPTADQAVVNLYRCGTPGTDELLESVPMERASCGTWTALKQGNLNGVYYTFSVRIGDYTAEACDPYARTTGVNGQRAMVIDLASTNPEGWDTDTDPHGGAAFNDAVIYELHIRDLSMDKNSGIRRKGKFLGLCETGTRTPGGIATGLDHILELGVTHLHLMPVFDFGSVDESRIRSRQFNWGYDPVNFNVPEGSYSTDPFHGEVRVREMKQMIRQLHRHGISVVMDVVYNHVYDAGSFCFNKLVPQYFSRVTDGVYSNGSGCGNDTASERSMVRKYIVDSVCYWADEYHIDGFRFDLVGLLDVDTVNEIVAQVHVRHPNVVFYGEGWHLNTAPTKPCVLATQDHADLTPGFAYFNDTLRDALRGSVFHQSQPGFVTGAVDTGERLDACFRGMPGWCCNPAQVVNYVSCHDNNTLLDRIALAAPGRSLQELARMNRLAAAFYLTAQGIPFMQAGEEMLRSKPDSKGGFVENSFRSPDAVNALKWENLGQQIYRSTFAYYKGLIDFRKAHRALRMTDANEILSNLVAMPADCPHVHAYRLRADVPGEEATEIFFAFSAAYTEQTLALPAGQWQLCVDGDRAGTAPLATLQGSIRIPPISAMVLVKNQT